MNIWFFPETENRLLQDLWEQQVHKLVQDVFRYKNVVDSHRPPTQDDIETYLAKSESAFVIERLFDIEEYERCITNLREELAEWARDKLYSPANEDERKAARTQFNQTKNRLTASLHSIAHIAAHDQEQRIVDWVESALTQVPKLNTTSNNHDLKAMREWLQTNHPEANIKSRGTIPLKWKQAYYNRSDS